MATGWRHRIGGVVGTAVLTTVTVLVVNRPIVQETFALVPFFGNPAPAVLSARALSIAVPTAVVVMLAAVWPLFKPRPRRILDTIMVAQKRVLLGMVALAALGYFKYSHRLPRSTLMLTTTVLLVALPVWFLLIRRRKPAVSRAILVGDDPDAMDAILAAADVPVLGYVSPPVPTLDEATRRETRVEVTDGGTVEPSVANLSRLGGLSRLEEVLHRHDVDTALFAFGSNDRAEFFGTLEVCHDHGVRAMVHREHADDVLATTGAGPDLVEVDLAPWDWQDYALKRVFDVAFAAVGLITLAPICAAVTAAIRLDSDGPVLYCQERTAAFGETFTVYKFRSMIAGAERETGPTVSPDDAGGRDPRVTRVGRFLRETHLDEIPQLWSVLVGDMSVVGPRPERPELDSAMEAGTAQWRNRWFVKPGLTGLAQINGATGLDPRAKLRHDVAYIRQQSFWFDVKILIRQFWQVGIDAAGYVSARPDRTDAPRDVPTGGPNPDTEGASDQSRAAAGTTGDAAGAPGCRTDPDSHR